MGSRRGDRPWRPAWLSRWRSASPKQRRGGGSESEWFQGPPPSFALPHQPMTSTPVALLAVGVIVALAQLLGLVAARLGQPRVLGDILGGILLGPSLMGALWPEAMAWLFSPAVRAQLELVAELGLVLFMFLVGLELNPALLRGRVALASRL